MASTVAIIRAELRALGNAEIAAHSGRFFKTGKGEYGEADRFLGVRVPLIRKLVKRHRDATLRTLVSILQSAWHEERLFAVLSLAERFSSADEDTRLAVFNAYVENLHCINNWDLVDGSAHLIVGPWLETRSRKPIYRLAQSEQLWERRVAIMSTFHFIRIGQFSDTLALAEILLHDDQDLIHKAVGWMLRETGNRDMAVEEQFLKKHYREMPRTMLRYAIEKFPESKRKAYLHAKI